jgi:hypothetical protein
MATVGILIPFAPKRSGSIHYAGPPVVGALYTSP